MFPLILMSPDSIVPVVIKQAGCLLLVAQSPILPTLAIVSVVLSAWHKPVVLMLRPIILAPFAFGYKLKLWARDNRDTDRANFLAVSEVLTVALYSAFVWRVWLYQMRQLVTGDSGR